MKVIIEKPTVT